MQEKNELEDQSSETADQKINIDLIFQVGAITTEEAKWLLEMYPSPSMIMRVSMSQVNTIVRNASWCIPCW